MSSTTESSDVVPSGFYGPGKSRSATDVSRGVSAVRQRERAEAAGQVFEVIGETRRAQQLAEAMPAMRKAKKATSQSRRGAAPAKSRRGKVAVTLAGPTPERVDKGDVLRSTGGRLVAEDGLEALRRGYRPPEDEKALARAQELLMRLHHRCSLDHDPGMNDRMYEAGRKYERLVHLAGLTGTGAQNILALRGEGHAPHSMPVSLAAAHYRGQLRQAWAILSPKTAAALHALLIEGRSAEDVGREVSSYRSAKECSTAATTVLRIALWTLVEARWA